MSRKNNLVSYFGGKYHQLHWLLPLLQQGNYHFVDAMCGSANVALNVNYPLITVNDINDDIINLFNVLRDHHDEFIKKLYFSPFSRSLLNQILTEEKTDDKIREAWKYYLKCQLGYGANGSQNNHKGCAFELTIQKSQFYKVQNWNSKIRKLPAIIDRLRQFQIESRHVFEIIDTYSHPNTIMYLDPPYPMSTRNGKKRYKYEVDNTFHEELIRRAIEYPGFVAISSYNNDLYNDLLFPAGFYKHINPSKNNTARREVVEALYTNYDPSSYRSIPLFETRLIPVPQKPQS